MMPGLGTMHNGDTNSFYDTDLTDIISGRPEVILRSIGFQLYNVEIEGQQHCGNINKDKKVLVKVFCNLPIYSLIPEESEHILEKYVEDMEKWKRCCSTNYFATIIGRCTSDETFLSCPVYRETKLIKPYIQESQGRELLAIFLGLAQGISQMHKNEIIHGDIRGDNILIDSNGKPRLCDYSLTSIISHLDHSDLRSGTEVCGALRWMPIEDAKLQYNTARVATKAGDIWSFGMTMFELWSGQSPYRDVPTERVIGIISTGILPRFPRQSLVANLEVLRETVKFLTSLCWRANPRDRISAEDLVALLQQLCRGEDLQRVKRMYLDNELEPSEHSTSRQNTFYSCTTSASSSLPTVSDGATIRVEDMRGPSPSSRTDTETLSDISGRDRKIYDNSSHSTGSSTSWQPFGERSGTDSTSSRNILPPMPSPTSMKGIAQRTILENFKIKNNLNLKYINERTDLDNVALWTTSILLDGKLLARATKSQKRQADDEASGIAIQKLVKKHPDILPYLPTLNAHIIKFNLKDRVQLETSTLGPSNETTWVCRVIWDGFEMARGEGLTRKAAEEEAARNAYGAWPRS